MLCTVYRCRYQGHKLDPETIKASPAFGELVVRRRGHFQRVALLTTPAGHNVIPVMGKVRILELNALGVLLAGLEMLPGRGRYDDGPTYPQAWWCVLGDQMPAQRAGKLCEAREGLVKDRNAYEIGRVMTQGSRRPGF